MALTRAEIAKILLFGNPKKYTWATKPSAASVPAGRIIFITDVGGWNGTTHSGSFWFSNGTLWRPVSGVLLLASTNTRAQMANDTSEQTMYSYTLKGGVMAVGDSIRVSGKTDYAGSTSTVTIRGRYDTAEFFGQPGISYGYGIFQHSFHNRATSTQLIGVVEPPTHNTISSFNSGQNQGSNPRLSTISVDSSIDRAISLTMQKSVITDAMYFDSLQIELLAG